MKTRTLALIGGLAAAALTASQANAYVQVVGNGKAHDCFIYAKAGLDPDAGITLCTEALNEEYLSAHDRAGTMINRGVMESSKGQLDDAMADYEASIKIDPTLGDAYVNRGAALISQKRYADALVDINKGIALGVSYPHLGYYNRAVAEELLGQYRESYYDYKHVLELEPNFTKASDELKFFIVTNKPG
jgi:tetratricopeptide (TPR) repeat protein